MQDSDLLNSLRALEVSLHKPETRGDPNELGHHLHQRFREFGRSGATYTREQTLEEFSSEPQAYHVWSQEFQLQLLSQDIALLTYRSAHIESDGQLTRHTNRSSVWQYLEGRWLLRFHQGTPTSAFTQGAA
ncbi:nuclear transport factor 2 family protein [Candidatus Nitrotoga sp. BS]|uniref:nuclear transport factor 2 family protein n=1 Tax=Candidatus Nitrotoga sp. BS TaxID=2890408 RepID=UPI00403E1597